MSAVIKKQPKTFEEYNKERINTAKHIKQLESTLHGQLQAITALNSIATTVQQVHDKLIDLKPLKEDVQFIKGVYTMPSTPVFKKRTTTREERSAARRKKLLKIPNLKA